MTGDTWSYDRMSGETSGPRTVLGASGHRTECPGDIWSHDKNSGETSGSRTVSGGHLVLRHLVLRQNAGGRLVLGQNVPGDIRFWDRMSGETSGSRAKFPGEIWS